MLHLPQVDLGDGFEVHVPEADAAVSSSGGEALLTGVHAEDPSLEQTRSHRWTPVQPGRALEVSKTHRVGRLDRPDQGDASPHVDVSVQSSRVGQLVLGGRDTQDGLKVSRLPEDASLWGQRVPTQSPELQTARTFTCSALRTFRDGSPEGPLKVP